MTKIPYAATAESVTYVVDGDAKAALSTWPRFGDLVAALARQDVAAVAALTQTLKDWSGGRVDRGHGGVAAVDGVQMPQELELRLEGLRSRGEDATRFLAFWKRLRANPSEHSRQLLFRFLDRGGIPLTKSGHFLAYKTVRRDYLDYRTAKLRNRPGDVVSMPRGDVEENSAQHCAAGLHVGSLEYAEYFLGMMLNNSSKAPHGRIVVVEVDPADVVCVPDDHSAQKVRCCRYRVVGEHGVGPLDDAAHDETLPVDAIDLAIGFDDPPLPRSGEVGVGRKWLRFHAMSREQLLDETLATLREYAYRGLGVVGASCIPGGVEGLVDCIVRVAEMPR